MTWTRRLSLGLALCVFTSTSQAQSPYAPASSGQQPIRLPASALIQQTAAEPAKAPMPLADPGAKPVVVTPAPVATPAPVETPAPAAVPAPEPAPAEDDAPLGPTPFTSVKILQNAIFGEGGDAPINFGGWLDADYTYRSTGSGRNNIAPVENRFGNELLAREIGLMISKPLDQKCLSWGFNVIFIAGADASFLQPTAGYPAQTNPRFGQSFTDLNVTAHLPILTDGGVDVKIGRQTTCLGPMGALAWQRPFTSSDYAWYELEEGRYTGVSTVWHVSKRLDLYNGIEVGGWGVFFDNPSRGIGYLGQVNYWLDEEAKKTKVWLTVLTGPTGFYNDGNTTAVEVGGQHNYNKCFYQIVDFQMNYSKAPIFFQPPPGYQERAYDVYTYFGYHLTKELDVNSRFEWYKDVDGGGYPGGFGTPKTDFFETTVGLDYHPVKWLQFRPEVRYDHATHDAFGENYNKKDQLSIAADVLIKF